MFNQESMPHVGMYSSYPSMANNTFVMAPKTSRYERFIKNDLTREEQEYYRSNSFGLRNDFDSGKAQSNRINMIIIAIIGAICGVILFLAVLVGIIVGVHFATQSSSSSSTSATTLPTYGEACTSTCQPLNLVCDSTNICSCLNDSYYWSATDGSCVLCPSGFVGYKTKCWTYLSTVSGYTYSQATTACTNVNSVILETKTNTEWLYYTDRYYGVYQFSITGVYANMDQAWINATAVSAMNFQWSDGSTVNSAFFASGQPDNNGAGTGSIVEGCLAFSATDNYEFIDKDCSSNYDVFCEYNG